MVWAKDAGDGAAWKATQIYKNPSRQSIYRHSVEIRSSDNTPKNRKRKTKNKKEINSKK